MKRLTEICMLKVWNMVCGWEVQGNEYDETQQLIPYFDILSNNVRQNLMEYRVNQEGSFNARHVALFLYFGMENLSLKWADKDFNLTLLLTVGAEKLKDLKKLTLPREHLLLVDESKQLCRTTPNVESLMFYCTESTEDEVFFHISNLPLVEIRPCGHISDGGVNQLCNEHGKLRETLKVIDRCFLSNESFCLFMKTMTQVEDIGFSCLGLRKFQTLLDNVGAITLNVKSLSFTYADNEIEDELNAATILCPKVTEIFIWYSAFTQKIMCLLTKFKYLSKLKIGVNDPELRRLRRHVPLAEEEVAYEECNLCLPDLLHFCLYDAQDRWISTGYLFTILDMCPNLETLKLANCPGFTDKVAMDFARFMWSRKLQHLIISHCDALFTSGIEALMKMPTLKKLEIDVCINDLNNQQIESFRGLANVTNVRANVTLKLKKKVWVRLNFVVVDTLVLLPNVKEVE